MKDVKELPNYEQKRIDTLNHNFGLISKIIRKTNMKDDKIKIELIHWDYTCADGCCTDYGVRLKMNGEALEHPDSTDEQYISNSYMGDDVDTALRAVLKKLGYEVEVITRHEED